MKKKSLILALFTMLFSSAMAQTEIDAFRATEATWYGLDFTKATFFGNFSQFAEAGEKSGTQIKNKYMPGWNNIVIAESEKYDLKAAYKKQNIAYDLTIVKEKNEGIDPDDMFPLKSGGASLTKEQVAKVVSKYKTGKSGIGIVYVVESFDKNLEKAIIWVNFFDTATGKALISEKYEGKPGGIGLKNYWAKVILEVIKGSGSAYRKMAKKYK